MCSSQITKSFFLEEFSKRIFSYTLVMAGKERASRSQARVKLTSEQVEILNDFYMTNHRPSYSERHFVALRLGISDEKVKNWFQNRRAKNKKDSNIDYTQEYTIMDVPSRSDIYPNCNDLYKKRPS
ncbi:hypothetical protein PAEPH01_2324 [Pancytospora epiphaga]|nr:hypothetical protein PAEPH01_2324 [Pancytospora epiphaga]